jgi:glycosyltransferase involved in cell wall biosynthesis
MIDSDALGQISTLAGHHSSDEPPDSVLFVTPRWARDGGVGAHVQASAALLARNGVDVTVLVARAEDGEDVSGVTVYPRPLLFDRAASIRERLGEVLSSQFAVVHIHQVDDPEIVASMRANAPVVVSAHAYTACTSGVHYFRPGQECTRAHGPGCAPNLIARGCAHRRNPTSLPSSYRQASRGLEALRRSDVAVSYSSSVDRHLAVNGVARRAIVPYFPTMRAGQALGHEDRRRVVFAGRVVTPKGVGILVRAAREVDAEFLICGDGMQLNAMRRLTRRLGVERRVCFKGWLGPDELAEEFANASLVVVPSLWPEPFGLVGIEAFAAERPAVASATGGTGDWLEDGVSGLAVAPGDARELARALNALLADPERQRSMGAAGKTTVDRRFSPECHLAALLDCYELADTTWRSERRSRS